MLGIAGFFMRRRKKENDEDDGMKSNKVAPMPVVTNEAKAMRQTADEMLERAENVYREAMTVSEKLAYIRKQDNVVGTLTKLRKDVR